MLQYSLIAPCGMNCGICAGHLYRKVKCTGCNSQASGKPTYCRSCSIYRCEERNGSRFCFNCSKYPCRRLRQLDKRYRTRYGMSMIENLENIKSVGLRRFVRSEKTRWECNDCKSVLCVHRDFCVECGATRKKEVYSILL